MTTATEDMVAVEVLAQALEDAGLDPIEANRILGWDNIPKVRRLTGLDAEEALVKRKRKIPVTHIPYEEAAEFVQGLGLWPVDYGL